MARAITQHDRKARIRAHTRAGAMAVRSALRGAGAISNRKSARVKYTEAPPPKSLEVEPGSQDDVYNNNEILDVVITYHQ